MNYLKHNKRKSSPVFFSLLFIALILISVGCKGQIEYEEKALKWHEYGELCFNSGNYEEAIEAFSNAIIVEPKYKEAYKNRGNVYLDLKRYDMAMDDYDMAIKIDPEYPNPYNNRGNVLIREGKYEEAIEEINKAISLDPDFGLFYHNRAVALEKAARDDYRKACELGYQESCAYCD